MKWYNKKKTQMVDLDKVSGFVFIKASDVLQDAKTPDEESDFKTNGDKLEIIIGGSVFSFRGEQAMELYNLLTLPNVPECNGMDESGKQILKG
jgi:hypothetical protein